MNEDTGLPDVDWLFLVEAIDESLAAQADRILAAYDANDDCELGRVVRAQIEIHRRHVATINNEEPS